MLFIENFLKISKVQPSFVKKHVFDSIEIAMIKLFNV